MPMPMTLPPRIWLARPCGCSTVPQSATHSMSTMLTLPVSTSTANSAKVVVKSGRHADAAQVVLGDADQSGPGNHVRGRSLGDRVDVLRRLLAGELAAEFDRLLRRLRIGDRLRRIGLADHLLVAEVVVVGLAAEHLGGDLGQLRLGVHRRDIHGARLGRGREAAGLVGVPGQAAAAVAALDDHVVPVVVQHIRRNTGGRRVGVGAEIADAGMDVQLAVRRDAHACRRSRWCRPSDSPGRCRCRSPWCRCAGRISFCARPS